MSFTANNGATINGATITSGSDNYAVGAQRVDQSPMAGSATYVVTVANGTTAFTAQYKQASGGTATFNASRIIIQVF
ncbi:MAG: hypothetical protein JOZ99_09235 [Actinobacteria bacterium]|nr:hypothetical protein [Actinomycetota bacterium]